MYIHSYTNASVNYLFVKKKLKINEMVVGGDTYENLNVSLANGGINISGGKISSIGTQEYWKNARVSCKAGERFKVTFTRTSNSSVSFHILFCRDDDSIVASYVPYGETYSNVIDNVIDYEVTAPSGATLMYVHSATRSYFLYIKKKMEMVVEDKILTNNALRNFPHTFISRQCQHDGYPENSIIGAINAKNRGYDHVRVSVRFTSDGVPVLVHDATINAAARNTDGTTISSNINIADITLAQADAYDWGIVKGTQFAGLKTPTLEGFLKACAYKGIKPVVEIKVDLTAQNVTTIMNLIVKYGLVKSTTITGSMTVLQLFSTACGTLNFGLICHPSNEYVDRVKALKNGNNIVRLDIFNTDTVTPEFLTYAYSNDVSIKVGSCYNITQLITWLELGVDMLEVANINYPTQVLSDYYNNLT